MGRGASPVPMQMWEGEPSFRADVAAVSAVPTKMWGTGRTSCCSAHLAQFAANAARCAAAWSPLAGLARKSGVEAAYLQRSGLAG